MIASSLASALGAPEGAIKLILSIFIGYPLAFLHRLPLLYLAPPLLKHLLFFLEGLCICYYNFGIDTFHTWLNITITYLVLLFCGGSKFSVIFIFVFNTCYLVVGYFTQISQHEFGISWTMPHCVLTLRLSAVAFDYYDGKKSNSPNPAALSQRPSYLEMLGHSFFFGGVLVGPQFSMKRYLQFVNLELIEPKSSTAPDSINPSLKKFLVGVVYLGIFQALALYIPDTYIYSSDFQKLGYFTKCALILVWGKNALHKYVGVWLIQARSIILMGMSYNGIDKNGVKKWDGCTNIKILQLETGESFSDFIQAFNVNTNQWMAVYIYKRLRFLGNKMLSQFITLFYLALWHGVQSGYYMCFLLELLETNAEMQVQWFLSRLRQNVKIPNIFILNVIGRILRKVILMFLWSYALVSFVLLDSTLWTTVYGSVYYIESPKPMESMWRRMINRNTSIELSTQSKS
ncbi:lysophospholipid acyltransferase 5 [Biomphalaria pfeifferi]|uniref:Lysophospholipid acyltransferase 5 n=1 Tax=Biomphalaria pfeifferi TaxID=112525 RepID=A0AAD8BX40_BIOPF|nr:lysophospholipid acyltransferase 5 [Biomphalaria pfeifferi]